MTNSIVKAGARNVHLALTRDELRALHLLVAAGAEVLACQAAAVHKGASTTISAAIKGITTGPSFAELKRRREQRDAWSAAYVAERGEYNGGAVAW